MRSAIRNNRNYDRYILHCNGPQLAALARVGAAQHGRGAVLIDLAVEPDPGHTIATYLPAPQLMERIQGSTNDAELQRFLDDMTTYDPAKTIIVVVQRPGGLWHLYQLDLAALAVAPGTSPALAA